MDILPHHHTPPHIFYPSDEANPLERDQILGKSIFSEFESASDTIFTFYLIKSLLNYYSFYISTPVF